MSAHKHRANKIQIVPFAYPVSMRENPKAHGGVCEVHTCSCGATRKYNVNGAHVEKGTWSTED